MKELLKKYNDIYIKSEYPQLKVIKRYYSASNVTYSTTLKTSGGLLFKVISEQDELGDVVTWIKQIINSLEV